MRGHQLLSMNGNLLDLSLSIISSSVKINTLIFHGCFFWHGIEERFHAFDFLFGIRILAQVFFGYNGLLLTSFRYLADSLLQQLQNKKSLDLCPLFLSSNANMKEDLALRFYIS